jgi:hypothetical protein
LEQAFYIPRPSPNIYTIWWPWVKNFYGQGSTFINYFWVDKSVKEDMGK